MNFSAKTTSGSVGTAAEEKKKAKKQKLEEKQSISNIYMTLTHQNEA